MSPSESERVKTNTARYALTAILVGVVLLGVSFLPALAGGQARWSKEQALEYQQASLRIQELTHTLASQTPETASRKSADEFQDALGHFHDLQSNLETARGQSGHLAAVLRVAGLLLLVGGAISFLPMKRKPAELRPFTATRDPNRCR